MDFGDLLKQMLNDPIKEYSEIVQSIEIKSLAIAQKLYDGKNNKLGNHASFRKNARVLENCILGYFLAVLQDNKEERIAHMKQTKENLEHVIPMMKSFKSAHAEYMANKSSKKDKK